MTLGPIDIPPPELQGDAEPLTATSGTRTAPADDISLRLSAGLALQRIAPRLSDVFSRVSAIRTVAQIADEALDGFAARSFVGVQIWGARTVGVLALPSDVGSLSDTILRASLSESATRESTDFARAATFSVSTARPAAATTVEIREADQQLFGESELAHARALADDASGSRWLSVTVNVSTYAPWSRVYLVMTSEPIVFGTAFVGRDGTAELTGALPLEMLEAGAHRVRVIGFRDFGSIRVDEAGQLQLSQGTISEIQRFDTGTTAVVRMVGQGIEGGGREVVRYVPLRGTCPFWVLVVLDAIALTGLYLGRRRKLDTTRRRAAAFGSLAIGSVAGAWIGWLAVCPEVIAGSVAVGIVGSIVVMLARRGGEAEEAHLVPEYAPIR